MVLKVRSPIGQFCESMLMVAPRIGEFLLSGRIRSYGLSWLLVITSKIRRRALSTVGLTGVHTRVRGTPLISKRMPMALVSGHRDGTD